MFCHRILRKQVFKTWCHFWCQPAGVTCWPLSFLPPMWSWTGRSVTVVYVGHLMPVPKLESIRSEKKICTSNKYPELATYVDRSLHKGQCHCHLIIPVMMKARWWSSYDRVANRYHIENSLLAITCWYIVWLRHNLKLDMTIYNWQLIGSPNDCVYRKLTGQNIMVYVHW